MDDLISRQAAINVLEERLRANGYSNVALVSELNRSIGYLMRLPSAERHGRWIDIPFAARWICSNCDYISEFASFKYCPDCGAIMDLEDEE